MVNRASSKAVGDTDLVINIAQIILDYLLGGPKQICDFLVLESLHDQGDNLQFLGRQAVANPGADKVVGVGIVSRVRESCT